MENKKVILAIDDNVAQLNLFQKQLAEKYDIRTVTSAANALRFLNSENVADLILLDIEMPNITGFDFLYDIRKIPSYMDVPIVIVSGKTGKEFYTEARNSSAFDVLSKPVEPDLLIDTIEKALSADEGQEPD